MSEPQKKMGYLNQIDGRQVIVFKHWLHGESLKAKSVQLHAQYKATFYEWDMHVAFLFDCEGKRFSLKVGKDLELVPYAEENILGEEYRFRWEDYDGSKWRRLEHQKDNVVKFLCCDEKENIFLMDESKEKPGISNFLFHIDKSPN